MAHTYRIRLFSSLRSHNWIISTDKAASNQKRLRSVLRRYYAMVMHTCDYMFSGALSVTLSYSFCRTRKRKNRTSFCARHGPGCLVAFYAPVVARESEIAICVHKRCLNCSARAAVLIATQLTFDWLLAIDSEKHNWRSGIDESIT